MERSLILKFINAFIVSVLAVSNSSECKVKQINDTSLPRFSWEHCNSTDDTSGKVRVKTKVHVCITGSRFQRVDSTIHWINHYPLDSGADPGFFLGGDAPLRNEVIDG